MKKMVVSGKVCLFATKDIAPNTELRYDYALKDLPWRVKSGMFLCFIDWSKLFQLCKLSAILSDPVWEIKCGFWYGTCIGSLLLRFLVVDTRSVETTIAVGHNMQMSHSLRCKQIDRSTAT